MRLQIVFASVCLLACRLSAALPPEYESLKAEAEKLYLQSCRRQGFFYAEVNELYQQVVLTNLPPAEQRWVRFRRADTQWRSPKGIGITPWDPKIGEKTRKARIVEARDQLAALISDIERVEDRDDVWAEAHASLGDLSQETNGMMPPSEGVAHYKEAFGWLAAEHDGEPPPDRFLAIVARMTLPQAGGYLTVELLEKAIKLSQDDEEKAHFHYLIAINLRDYFGDPGQHPIDDPVAIHARIVTEFEAALNPGKTNLWWYPGALYQYAEWIERGSHLKDKNGNWREFKPDYVKALELCRRIVTEFQEDKSGRTDSTDSQLVYYRYSARQMITNIAEPKIAILVPGAFPFPPDSGIHYFLDWRNVKQIELTLYPSMFNRGSKIPAATGQQRDWLRSVDVGGLEKIQSWTYDTQDKGDHEEGIGVRFDMDVKIKPGTYLLEAKSGDLNVRTLIVVAEAKR